MTSAYESLQDKAGRAADMLADAAPASVKNAATEVKKQADVQIDRFADKIREKPLQSAAIAAGVGFLFAVIARR